MSEQTNTPTHQSEQNKFTIPLDGEPAFLEYELGPQGTLMVMHTEVPPAYTGKGYATQLARSVMRYAQEQGLQVMPYCTYMASFLKRHKEEYKSSVSPEFGL